MKKHNFKIDMTVTSEQIEDILSSALNGCTYWVDEVRIIQAPAPYNKENLYPSQALTNGFALNIHDSEENKWHKLTLNKFLKGLALSYGFDYEDYDSCDAEAVLQRAILGEVIYA